MYCLKYSERKAWHRRKNGTYTAYSGPVTRFVIQKDEDRWHVIDKITGEEESGRTFTECRMHAERMAREVSEGIPEDYAVGMTAYTCFGEKVRIDSIGKKGYDCYFTYLLTGKKDYIDEVNHLYIRRRTHINL